MRLLTFNSQNELSLTSDLRDDETPPYAILSHTWGADSDEVTFTDLQQGHGQNKPGYAKIQFCGEQTRVDGIKYFWIDTCCIDNKNHVELSKAITCMFRWYRNAVKCYVYLSDVTAIEHEGHGGQNANPHGQWETAFRSSRWFKRGWTLQELLAPKTVQFFSRDLKMLGDKVTLAQSICDITTIPIAALQDATMNQFSIEERIRWTQGRQTKEKEDVAYCLLGIFDVFMPLIYGEGENAMHRLRKEINDRYGKDLTARFDKSKDSLDCQSKSLGLCLGSAPLISPNYFVGRAVEIEKIHSLLRPSQDTIEQRRVVLSGIGGVGKTQLTIAYARYHQQHYTAVLWLNATTETTLKTGFRSVMQGVITAHDLSQLSDDRVVARAHEWLSDRENVRWLLIFDNHDELDTFNINDFIPNVGHGSILITTRLQDLVSGEQLTIYPLSNPLDSLSILRNRSQRAGIEDDPGARRLALRLAGLPLALATAGAYLRKTTLTFDQYLQSYEERFNVNPRRPLQLQEYQDRTLYTTWDLSYRRLERYDPLAAQLLQLLAYFDNQEIWFELVKAGLTNESTGWVHEVTSDYMNFENIMEMLVAYHFVESHPLEKCYRMHNCVHDWAMFQLNKDPSNELYWYAVRSVARSVPKGLLDARQLQFARLARHGLQCLHPHSRHIFETGQTSIGNIECLHIVASLLQEQMQLDAAAQMFKRILAVKKKLLGPDHVSTLLAVNNIGTLYLNQGKLDQAEQIYGRALTRCRKAQSLAHNSLVLRLLDNLGTVYIKQNRLEEAEQIYDQALPENEVKFGPFHVSTYDMVNNLGSLYNRQGRKTEAERMYKRALAGYEELFGPHHKTSLYALHNLSVVLATQGKWVQAKQMCQRALAGMEKLLGPNHVFNLNTSYDLGFLYYRENRLDEAERMFHRVLNALEKARGSHHTLTLDVRCSPGHPYVEQGRLDEAERMHSLILSLGRSFDIETQWQNTITSLAEVLSERVRRADKSEEAVSHLARLVRHMDKWRSTGDTRDLWYCFIAALINIRDDKNAQIALVLQLKMEPNSSLALAIAECDNCQCHITPNTGRHICRTCADVDLCNACMSEYTEVELDLSGCNGHEFFDAGLKTSEMLSLSDMDQEIAYDTWMAKLKQTYKVVDQAT